MIPPGGVFSRISSNSELKQKGHVQCGLGVIGVGINRMSVDRPTEMVSYRVGNSGDG